MSTGNELPVGNKLVPYGTPTHVTELAILILKIAFSKLPENHPHRFTDDYNTTGVLFDTTYNKAADIVGKKPLILISRGVQNLGVLSVGDLATTQMPRVRSDLSNVAEAAIDIRVISKSKAECEILSQFVFSQCMMLRSLLPKFSCVHSVTNINMSPVGVFEQDDEMFITQLLVSYSLQYTWQAELTADLLRSIQMHLAQTE